MTLTMLAYALGNTLLALPLAALAWAIARTGRHPAVAHLAWVLVMIRLVMPPIAALPWLSFEVPLPRGIVAAPMASRAAVSTGREAGDSGRPLGPARRAVAGSAARAEAAGAASSAAPTAPRALPPHLVDRWTALALLWPAGTILVVAVSVLRLRRFRRALEAALSPADARVRRLAERAAADLGVPPCAGVAVIPADAAPFVWSCLGRPSVVLPASIVAEMSDDQLRLVLMHELAHVRRGDHLVRWLDWAVVAWLWWNPLAWVARRGLRATEELACDALVLRTRAAAPRLYGDCLLTVSEALIGPAIPTPPQACAMGDGSLEERMRFIMSAASTKRPSLALRALAIAVAGVSMAAGVACVGPGPAAAAAQGEARGDRTLEASVAGATSLRVDSVNGSITVVRDDAVEAMQVTAVIDGRLPWLGAADRRRLIEGARLVADKDARGSVAVRVVFPEIAAARRQPPAAAITIRTPALAEVRAESINGAIRTEGDLGELSVETTNGAIDVTGTASAVKAGTTNGAVLISLADGAAGSVDAESTNGRIVLELPAAWDGLVNASTTNGRVTARDIDGVTTRSVTGGRFRSQGGAAEGPVAKLETTNGSIEMRKR
jgi:beta-lactamase regulating signal transducer with metallopeptidase domain